MSIEDFYREGWANSSRLKITYGIRIDYNIGIPQERRYLNVPS